jgi:hypothetical protein
MILSSGGVKKDHKHGEIPPRKGEGKGKEFRRR